MALFVQIGSLLPIFPPTFLRSRYLILFLCDIALPSALYHFRLVILPPDGGVLGYQEIVSGDHSRDLTHYHIYTFVRVTYSSVVYCHLH